MAEDDYIDDMQHMLDDVRAGTFVDVPQENTATPNTPPVPEDSPATAFDKLLEDARRPLFDGCTKFTKLSFIVKLLHLKSIGGWSIKSFDMLLDLLRSSFPDALLPQSYEELRSLKRGLGFKYHKIHACPNDCILFWKENAELNECPVCKALRWMPNAHGSRVIPQKVLHHFPLKPRLQLLFMSAKITGDMRWHKEQRAIEDTSMRHPADSECWKKFDEHHSWFAADPRNVRLGLACDGFTPFNNLAKPHSIWPVILISYNLPPWSCMKDQYFMTFLIIPGPKSPGNEIDVYLQPLLDELIELWEYRVSTYDAVSKETFMLHTALLWTINDFPAYVNISGWSTKGKLACPSCNAKGDYNWLKYGRKHFYMGHRHFLPLDHIWRRRKGLFNGKEDHRMPPRDIGGYDILTQLQMIEDVQFGKSRRKRKRTTEELNWTKCSIFFQLPYWSTLQLRHNLDVMHIEKNITENILFTLMNTPGKTKDNINSRRDLEILGYRKELHLRHEGDHVTMPHALYALHGDERHKFCEWLSEIKFPDGFSSNISNCVSLRDCKIGGLKSHDYHVFLQRLLPIAAGGFLRSDIVLALTKLNTFFKELCVRTLDVNRLSQLQTDIVTILCKLEMIFPPSFFDVMVHLAIHLSREAILGGPIQYRWMYSFERYLRKFKLYVKNKARPEGSIAEAYIHSECLTFCSIYLNDVETKFNRADRNVDADEEETIDGFKIFNQKVRSLGSASNVQLEDKLFKAAIWYVLNNCQEI
ncbi:uncharacterized protein LOC122278155 [Carya illinoinensis]|uniref:uncharacterized protein LOC122278155 n=1 Tax=Carya illinoinensis TaxID=32201 RepID=UPI001C71EF4A|nr:uncharacterized protein LOC122278155 [Carya illinoinensis]XP_042944189.1 uncharacterized protein LOC122278155 [Carya illinoinensis]XP_042944190.1 uncharacterized protein LOC122278155 [Carya illinoinensis]XP_042944191.1 uncharacterized protein LOC122278155 [Carya illinoinensis]XP_042944192.1 uncharacterized protein LOC122278155 [Carya illinoinensis]XP_042944193.1 uncharacterized protein LOC122278155 [Carya illinoinensis]XP_042944194.1 uncharacterized protein LOC122278155 [Carya illinoinensi